MTDFHGSCGEVRDLVATFAPVLRFDQNETIFPVSSDSWLSHCDSQILAHGLTRGTAIWRLPAPTSASEDASAVGGCAPTAPGDPGVSLVLTSDPSDVNAIGNPAYAGSAGESLFLSIGGRMRADTPGARLDSGDAIYDGLLYSVAYHSFHPEIRAYAPPTNRWTNGITPQAPVMDCKIDWLPAVVQASTTADADGLTVVSDLLRPYFSLTYSMLYPARLDPASRRREGQWEAISLFFKADDIVAGDPGDPPAVFRFTGSVTPRFLSYSQGPEQVLPGGRDELIAETRSFAGEPLRTALIPQSIRLAGTTHPVVFIAEGSHRNFFAPVTFTLVAGTPGSPGSGAGLESAAVTLQNVAEGFVAVGGWVFVAAGIAGAAAGPIPAAIVALLGLIILIIAALIELVAIVLAIIGDIVNAFTSVPAVPDRWVPNPDEAGEPTTVNGVGVAAAPAGVDPSASVRMGDDGFHGSTQLIVDPIIGLVDDDPACAAPSWATYSGRWGINVDFSTDGDWESGSFRLDPLGRGVSYWTLKSMVRFALETSAGL